jgi:glyoxalase/bleomycin resistance protein/dioxygenase superfamily protein
MPNPVPAGYATVTPYLCVSDAAKLIEFLKQAFDAQLLFKMDGPGGRIMHAEMTIGDSRIMLAQPEPGKETHAMLHLCPIRMRFTNAPSPPEPRRFASRRINSTATAAPACGMSLATSGI